jgi:hypothetical protein
MLHFTIKYICVHIGKQNMATIVHLHMALRYTLCHFTNCRPSKCRFPNGGEIIAKQPNLPNLHIPFVCHLTPAVVTYFCNPCERLGGGDETKSTISFINSTFFTYKILKSTLKRYTASHVCRESRSWGQCYDHNFQRFPLIFGGKIGVFLKNICDDHIFAKTGSILSM